LAFACGIVIESIVPQAAEQGVATAPTSQYVSAAVAVEYVNAGISDEGIAEARADEVLNTHERVEAGSHRVLSC